MSSTLPDELIWAENGHLSDVALTTLADGEEALLPRGASSHAETCVECSQRLGTLLLVSLEIGGAIEPTTSTESSTAKALAPAFPMRAVLLAAVVSVLGLVPTALELAPEIRTLRGAFGHVVPAVARGIAQLVARYPTGWTGGALLLGASLALLSFAYAVVRSTTPPHGASS